MPLSAGGAALGAWALHATFWFATIAIPVALMSYREFIGLDTLGDFREALRFAAVDLAGAVDMAGARRGHDAGAPLIG